MKTPPTLSTLLEFLHEQFPATVGNIQLRELQNQINALRRERDECQFALGYDEGTLLENIKKIKAWAESNVKLAWEKNNNSIAYMENLELQVQVMREALEAGQIMWRSSKPRKLDEALCWNENETLAQDKIKLALSIPPLPSQYVKRDEVTQLANAAACLYADTANLAQGGVVESSRSLMLTELKRLGLYTNPQTK